MQISSFVEQSPRFLTCHTKVLPTYQPRSFSNYFMLMLFDLMMFVLAWLMETSESRVERWSVVIAAFSTIPTIFGGTTLYV